MLIARLHKGGLAEAMETAREFETEQEMKEWFAHEYGSDGVYFSSDDVVIDYESAINDGRTGWKDTMYVCTKRFGEKDYVKMYGCPQCIGMCATDYVR